MFDLRLRSEPLERTEAAPAIVRIDPLGSFEPPAGVALRAASATPFRVDECAWIDRNHCYHHSCDCYACKIEQNVNKWQALDLVASRLVGQRMRQDLSHVVARQCPAGLGHSGFNPAEGEKMGVSNWWSGAATGLAEEVGAGVVEER